MNNDIQNIYIKLLKYGWKVMECENLGNGCVSISIYDPKQDPAERTYWYKTGNNLGKLFRAPGDDRASSYLLTPAGR